MHPQPSSHCVASTKWQLRIDHAAWESSLRRLLTRNDSYAVGTVRRHAATGESLLLVDDLEVSAETPDGGSRPPLDDWCVVFVDSSRALSVRQAIDNLRPNHSQLLVMVILDRDVPSRVRLVLWDAGSIVALDSCQIVGAGMLRLEHSRTNNHSFDPQRCSRTRAALGDALHDRLAASTVTVVGLGRNGSQLCFQLASLNVGRLRLLDADVMGIENLDGMPGLTVDDVGLSKAEALAQRLLSFRPDLSLTYLRESMTTQKAATLLKRPCDLFITAVDNDSPRLGISLLAGRTLTPHLDVGTLVRRDDAGRRSLFADIRLLLPGMCVDCVGGLDDSEAVLYQLAAPDGSLRRGPRREWFAQRSGSLAHVNAIACGTALELWLRLLQGEIGAYWQRLTWEAGSSLQVDGSLLHRSTACPYCRGR